MNIFKTKDLTNNSLSLTPKLAKENNNAQGNSETLHDSHYIIYTYLHHVLAAILIAA